MLKKITLTTLFVLTVFASGCGNNNTDTATPDTAATSDEAVAATSATEKSTTPVDKAIAEQGLTVNDQGEIIDKDGNKVETTADGKVTIQTADGSTVEVNANEVKASNTADNGGKGGSKNNTGGSNQPAQPQGGNGNNTSGGSGNAGGNSLSPSPQPEKTWHEAEYKTVHHEAVTEQRYVVDKEAYSYEEPVYEKRWVTICNDCGITDEGMSAAEWTHHIGNEAINGGKGSYRNEPRQVQVGTKVIEVPEQGHYETVVVQEAYDEQVLVREAGWY